MISVQTKKEFIRWFLKRYQLKRRECVWILHYLLNHEENLKNVHFTDEAHYCPRAMIISTTKSLDIPFRFYKGNLMTADAEKTFHDMTHHAHEKLYIQLNYPNKHICEKYVTVLEDNQYLPVEEIGKGVKQDAEQLIVEMEERLVKAEYDRLIDAALDERDDKAFMYLTGEFRKMGEEMK
ncbi:ReoY family proteolytic degradation factor [Sporosarcina jiandibaonis]|uniref:ReoY family proteolytic degradation factor n=1 Tax=Sporosarcina jiandibaonis TaxID=2715535 RepID=UPI0015561B3F|nr:ReoY family proteolytic degradation factor [Sporosarcina jiandibaonis]